jgi:hypothetical protein
MFEDESFFQQLKFSSKPISRNYDAFSPISPLLLIKNSPNTFKGLLGWSLASSFIPSSKVCVTFSFRYRLVGAPFGVGTVGKAGAAEADGEETGNADDIVGTGAGVCEADEM